MGDDTRYARHQVETLCLLHAVGRGGCAVSSVAARLGLSGSLASAVGHALGSLEAGGLLVREEARVVLTDEGRESLDAALAVLGTG